MRIDAYIDNPVISNQQEYYELLELLEEIDPKCNSVELRQEVVIIENIARRTFKYPRNPTIQWVAGRLRYMVENGL
ncbi:hypothetical protein GA398_08295 [Bacteroides xylanisolvens]|uniref:Uncharacterized protein n=1 Tax=Bacteroides xylanisolvens TaxID=371601 RepID=A0A7J5PYE3_9BACE|nr:hypothetical protein [Bacteroides xylanisolvens]KAB6148246.1 hypothetical protein GA398_08295 [Bacteroides xylanisolvens]